MQHSRELFRCAPSSVRDGPHKIRPAAGAAVNGLRATCWDDPKNAAPGLKFAPFQGEPPSLDRKSTLLYDDVAPLHGKTALSRCNTAPLDEQFTTNRREAASLRHDLSAIDAQDGTSPGPNLFLRVKSARVRSERHTYGANASNHRREPTDGDPMTARDDVKTARDDTKTAHDDIKTASDALFRGGLDL